MKILVTGGAGFVGTTLVPELLAKRYDVRVMDSLRFGGDALLPFFRHSHFSFVDGDVCDLSRLTEAAKGCDAIIHLAAIVGFPACRKFPDEAQSINVEGSRNVAVVAGKQRPVLFASTGSNYGALADEVCTEDAPLNPLSLYAKTKAEAEDILLNECTCIALRFATAYGLSPRLRLDLLINDFVFRALKERHLVVYESHFMRTFIHVYEMARSFRFALENSDRMSGEAYNVGDETQNFSKREISEKICSRVKDTYLHYADMGKDEDQRNYVVSYKKLKALGFKTEITIDEGIDELVRAFSCIRVHTPYANV